MPDPNALEQLAAVARSKLADGATPGEVFARLSLDDADPREAALAVCVAIGIPRTTAEQRLARAETGDPDFWNIADDEHLSRSDYASGIGDLLEAFGTFDLHVELSADQRRAVDHLAAAMREITPIRSGYALSHYRNISTGRLHRALVSLSRPERMGREVNTTTYWQHLVVAAELLGSDGDAEYVDAVRRCRDRIAPNQ